MHSSISQQFPSVSGDICNCFLGWDTWWMQQIRLWTRMSLVQGQRSVWWLNMSPDIQWLSCLNNAQIMVPEASTGCCRAFIKRKPNPSAFLKLTFLFQKRNLLIFFWYSSLVLYIQDLIIDTLWSFSSAWAFEVSGAYSCHSSVWQLKTLSIF